MRDKVANVAHVPEDIFGENKAKPTFVR